MTFRRKKKSRSIILITSILSILITTAVITTVCILNSDSHRQKSIEGAAELFFEAIEDGDYDKYMSLVPPYWQKHLRASLDITMRNALKDYMSRFNCGYGNHLHFKITDLDIMDKYEFKELSKKFKNWYNVEGEIEAYIFIDITVTDDYGKQWTFNDFDFIKIDGVWYIGFGRG